MGNPGTKSTILVVQTASEPVIPLPRVLKAAKAGPAPRVNLVQFRRSGYGRLQEPREKLRNSVVLKGLGQYFCPNAKHGSLFLQHSVSRYRSIQ